MRDDDREWIMGVVNAAKTQAHEVYQIPTEDHPLVMNLLARVMLIPTTKGRIAALKLAIGLINAQLKDLSKQTVDITEINVSFREAENDYYGNDRPQALTRYYFNTDAYKSYVESHRKDMLFDLAVQKLEDAWTLLVETRYTSWKAETELETQPPTVTGRIEE